MQPANRPPHFRTAPASRSWCPPRGVLEAPWWSPRTVSQASRHRAGRVSAVVRRGRSDRVWQTHPVDFDSVYDQGYARVAACTIVTTIADPTANAAALLGEARAGEDGGGGAR